MCLWPAFNADSHNLKLDKGQDLNLINVVFGRKNAGGISFVAEEYCQVNARDKKKTVSAGVLVGVGWC